MHAAESTSQPFHHGMHAAWSCLHTMGALLHVSGQQGLKIHAVEVVWAWAPAPGICQCMHENLLLLCPAGTLCKWGYPAAS
jgi:hypothetical protein